MSACTVTVTVSTDAFVPSDTRSLLFGSKIADLYVQPHIGGDLALLTGIARVVIERGALDEPFLAECTDGWEAYRGQMAGAKGWPKILEAFRDHLANR